ncbi:MAG TPA: DUF1189 family protein [Pontiella sp.]
MLSKRYNRIQLPFCAFFSKRIYQDVGLNWKGLNLAYLFILLAICCVPYTLKIRDHTLHALESSQVGLLNQIPQIRIKDGLASIDRKQPYYILNGSGEPVVIIDTTGSMNYIDDASVNLLLTETRLIVRRGGNLFNTFSLEMVEDLYLDKHVINGWFQTVRNMVAPLSYGIFLLLSFIFTVMTLLLFSIIGLIISAVLRKNLHFTHVLRISTVAATPSIIIALASAATETHIPLLALGGLTLLYLINGIRSCVDADLLDGNGKVDLKSLLNEESPSEKQAA